MESGVFFITLSAWVFHATAAISLGPFENVTTGPSVWDAWAKADPENVKRGQFSVQIGQDRLWLISRRLHRLNFDTPWDAASRGGIVSTLRLRSSNNSHNNNNNQTNTWTHSAYGRLDEDSYGEKLFSLKGRLFMLTYRGTKTSSPTPFHYHKLFFWDDSGDSQRWLEIPLVIDPLVSTSSANPGVPNSDVSQLSLSVPDQNGRSAYLVASVHGYANRGSEMSYVRLDLDFRGDGRNVVPALGTLKLLTRVTDSEEPSAVFFCAVRRNDNRNSTATTLYAFLQQMYSEGYVAEYGYAYALDLVKNGNASKVNLTSAGGDGQQTTPPMQFDEERMFQSADEMFIVGGYRIEGLSQVRNVRDVWALNLDDKRWKAAKNGNNVIPETENGGDYQPAYDQRNAKLYLVHLKNGVKVASVYT